MEFAKIVLLSVAAAILYGVVQDQITARVCVEYFTMGHPPDFGSIQDPTALAIGWGVLATWWVGVLLGIPLATVARIGNRPKLRARNLVIPIVLLMAFVGLAALAMGTVGFLAAKAGAVWVIGELKERLPPERHHLFLAYLWAHNAAYAAGFLGGIVCCVWVWRRRGRTA